MEITVLAGNAEPFHYAEDFVTAFKQTQFTFTAYNIGANQTGINATMNLSGAPPREGVIVTTKDASVWEEPVHKAFAEAMTKARIDFTREYNPKYGGTVQELTIFIGSKPPVAHR